MLIGVGTYTANFKENIMIEVDEKIEVCMEHCFE